MHPKRCMENPFRSDRLRFLIDQAGTPVPSLAELLGVSIQSLRKYMSGETLPSTEKIIMIADYFGVSLDYLLGRIPDRAVECEEDVYRNWWSMLFRASYETCLRSGKEAADFYDNGRIEAPWPFNIYDSIFGGPLAAFRSDELYCALMSKGCEKRLAGVLDTLSDLERDVILKYYRDGRTLGEIGEELGKSRERARQIIVAGLRKLRHPSRIRMLVEDYSADRVFARVEELRAKADSLEKEIKDREEKLNFLNKKLMSDACAVSAESPGALSVAERDYIRGVFTRTADEVDLTKLELSSRSYNALSRAGLTDCRKIIVSIADDSFYRIRNFGRRSQEEVISKLRDLGFFARA